MFRVFKRKPELVEFPRIESDPPRYLLILAVTAEQCLTRDEMQLMRGYGIGVQKWWLRHSVHDFAAVDLPNGDTPFTRELLLPAGQYTLGVGRPPAARRIRFQIASDGSLLPSPRTDAHAECLT